MRTAPPPTSGERGAVQPPLSLGRGGTIFLRVKGVFSLSIFPAEDDFFESFNFTNCIFLSQEHNRVVRASNM